MLAAAARTVRQSIERAGLPVFKPSKRRGHDGVMFAGLTDIGMLFVRCGNGGISHSPLETITADDANFAAHILLGVLENLEPSEPKTG